MREFRPGGQVKYWRDDERMKKKKRSEIALKISNRAWIC